MCTLTSTFENMTSEKCKSTRLFRLVSCREVSAWNQSWQRLAGGSVEGTSPSRKLFQVSVKKQHQKKSEIILFLAVLISLFFFFFATSDQILKYFSDQLVWILFVFLYPPPLIPPPSPVRKGDRQKSKGTKVLKVKILQISQKIVQNYNH